MIANLSPLRVLLVTLAGWSNRHQQHVIEYLLEENSVLKEQVKGRRLLLTDDQRRRLAAKGRRLGRRVLRQLAGQRSSELSLSHLGGPTRSRGAIVR